MIGLGCSRFLSGVQPTNRQQHLQHLCVGRGSWLSVLLQNGSGKLRNEAWERVEVTFSRSQSTGKKVTGTVWSQGGHRLD